MTTFYQQRENSLKEIVTKRHTLFVVAILITQFGFSQQHAPVISGVTDITSTQGIVHWYPVADAGSYIVRRYPEGTTDYTYYIPAVTDTFRKVVNMLPRTHYSVQVKAIFSGTGDSSDWSEPATFLTLRGCGAPVMLKARRITDSSVRFKWNLPITPVSKFDIRYRILGTDAWTEESKSATAEDINIKKLTANTTYEWQMRSKCDNDISLWVQGPVFTTDAGLLPASNTTTASYIKNTVIITAQITPNPNKGSFTIQMQLPSKEISTTLTLFNMQGTKLWQQDAGKTGGTVYSTVSLENKLTAGVYILVVQRADARLVQKIIISK